MGLTQKLEPLVREYTLVCCQKPCSLILGQVPMFNAWIDINCLVKSIAHAANPHTSGEIHTQETPKDRWVLCRMWTRWWFLYIYIGFIFFYLFGGCHEVEPKLPRAKRKIRMGKCSLQASHDEHARMFSGYKRNAWEYVNWERLIYFMWMYGIYKYVKMRQQPTIWVRDISVYLKIVFLPASLAVLLRNMMINYETARPPWTSFIPAVNAALQNMFIFI